MTTNGYAIERVRSHFPALDTDIAFFDGPGGTQAPRPVAAAIADALTNGLSNRDRSTAAGRAADDIVLAVAPLDRAKCCPSRRRDVLEDCCSGR